MLEVVNINNSSVGLRIDKWIKINLKKIPQSLIEKDLRNGKIKLNGRRVKSSTKLKLNDIIKVYNFNYKTDNFINKKNYNPPKKVIKLVENQIVENNENFIVINKNSGISVQGGTKSKKNLVDIYAKSEIFNNTKPYSVHRLDKDTSGVLIIAKNRETARLLTASE